MTISLPVFPYADLRDARSKRIGSRQSLVEVVEHATGLRKLSQDLSSFVCVLDLLQRHLPPNTSWKADDRHFKTPNGYMDRIEAYCDFSGPTELRIREFVWDDLFSRTPNCSRRQNARETIAHEFGHLRIPGHKRKVLARSRRSGFTTSQRAARDRGLDDLADISQFSERNLDLEEEADWFAYALLVPVTYLDGKQTIKELSQLYDVSERVAYHAALLSKDYHRSKFVLEANRLG